MFKRLLFGGVCLVVALVTQAPAVCWDAVLRRATHENFALLAPEGSLWQGRAQLAVLDPANGRLRPLMPLSWQIHGAAFFRGAVSWDFSISGSPPFTLDASIKGITVRTLRLDLPARFALERIPNAIGRLGWHGDMRLTSPTWSCSWRGICDGSASADWLGAAADIFPGRHLGDYRVAATAKTGTIDFIFSTTGGEVLINASGKLAPGGKVAVSGSIAGDPAFTERLPNIAGNFVQRTDDRGTFTFNFAN
jgi:hypothetical protein